jgi:hypothetical protein
MYLGTFHNSNLAIIYDRCKFLTEHMKNVQTKSQLNYHFDQAKRNNISEFTQIMISSQRSGRTRNATSRARATAAPFRSSIVSSTCQTCMIVPECIAFLEDMGRRMDSTDSAENRFKIQTFHTYMKDRIANSMENQS